MRKILTIVFVITIYWLPSFAGGKIYSYRDEKGRLVLTDIPKNSTGYTKKKSKKKKSYKYSYKPKLKSSDEYVNKLIAKYAKKHGLSEKLIHALIKTESDYNVFAVSRKGAKGLMQLMPETGKLYNVKDLFDPEQNIKAGVAHLKMLYDKYLGNLELTLAAYNAGETAVEKYNGIPPYKETENYVTKIMKLYEGDYYSIPSSYKRGVTKTASSIYRYYDENGTLCITNIYPGKGKKVKRVK